MHSLKDQMQVPEKDAIIQALKECNCVMTKAEHKLGVPEREIGYKIRKHGIRKEVGCESQR